MTYRLTRSCLTATALALFALAQPACAQRLPEAELVIQHATLISPERDAPLEDAWVSIHEGRITGVGTGIPGVRAQQTIDAANAWLIPGLIDSHVHLYHATGLRRSYTEDYAALYHDYMEQQPRSFLFHGFTTLVELNADAETNERFDSAPEHPNLVHCGQGVALSDGFMALELEGEPVGDFYPGYLIDHYAGGLVPEGADPADHTPRAVVNSIVEQGGQCVKLYYEEALWWPGGAPDFRLPSAEIVRDVVREAHARGLPVVLHATTPAGHAFAAETGIDILAHGMWEWSGQPFTAPDPSPATSVIPGRVIEAGIALQPTFQTIRNTASLFDPSVLADPSWQDVVPAAYLDYLRGDAQVQARIFMDRFGGAILEGAPAGMTLAEAQQAFYDRYEILIGAMAAHGQPLLFGSDTAVGGFGWASPPGLAGYWEMQDWVEAGIPLDELFRSLTLDNATAFGLTDVIGTIETGKRADLLILQANPLEDVAAYDQIETIILGGTVMARAALAARER
tara:strand:- start:9062 stop:10594 length:1533 start_codon:yes stop_codon:yes gene_type:complete